MTTPGGACTPLRKVQYNFLRARRTGLYQRVGPPTIPTVWGSGPSLYPSSPECVEEKFCELRVDGVLRSSRQGWNGGIILVVARALARGTSWSLRTTKRLLEPGRMILHWTPPGTAAGART